MDIVHTHDHRWISIQNLLKSASPFGNETGKLPCGIYEHSNEVRIKSNYKKRCLLINKSFSRQFARQKFLLLELVDLDVKF